MLCEDIYTIAGYPVNYNAFAFEDSETDDWSIDMLIEFSKHDIEYQKRYISKLSQERLMWLNEFITKSLSECDRELLSDLTNLQELLQTNIGKYE